MKSGEYGYQVEQPSKRHQTGSHNFDSSSIRSIQREVKRFHRTMPPPSDISRKALH